MINKETLKVEYQSQRARATAFLEEFKHQFSMLIHNAGVSLGVPLEGRVKTLESILEKVDRKGVTIMSCSDFTDYIGLRAITLFQKDVNTICKLIEKTFPVSAREDKEKLLESSNFGYLSRHYILALPRGWKKMPGFTGLDFKVEVQVRTLAQHIWATAAHVLQYKKEKDVPSQISRSIYRVAALLETVDLEFNRVLEERDAYVNSKESTQSSTILDADNLKLILDQSFPIQNRTETEKYSELLEDLQAFNIVDVRSLKEVVSKHKDAVMRMEKVRVEEVQSDSKNNFHNSERIKKGVFYTHVGLIRNVMGLEFGKKWHEYIGNRRR